MDLKRCLRNIIDLPTMAKNRLYRVIEKVKSGQNCKFKGKIRFVNRGSISFGNNCKVYGGEKYNPIGYGDRCNIVAEKGARISIGNDFGFSNGTIYSRERFGRRRFNDLLFRLL